jgi:DNA-binding phage protein
MPKESLRDNPPAIASYLTEMFEKNDLVGILDGIKFVVQSQNVKALAENIGMRRPQLAAALKAAKRLKSPIIVAKLDRLSRDVHFISGLMTHKTPFIVADRRRRSIHAPPLDAGEASREIARTFNVAHTTIGRLAGR